MRTLLIVFFSILLLPSLNAQNNSDIFNEYYADIVWTQVFNELEVKVPISVLTSDFFFYTEIEYLNHDIYFEFKNSEIDELDKIRNHGEFEIRKNIELDLLNLSADDLNLEIRGIHNNRILFNLQLLKSGSESTIQFATSDNSVENKMNFKNNKLVYSNSKNSGIIKKTDIYREKNDIVRTRNHYFNTKKYQISEEHYSNGVLTKLIEYKKSSSESECIIKKQHVFEYDSKGNLVKEKMFNNKGKLKQSHIYVYNLKNLIDTVFYKKNNKNGYVCYEYTDAGLPKIKKRINKQGTIEFKVKYIYEDADKIKSIEINNPTSSIWKMIIFEYNGKNKVSTITIIDDGFAYNYSNQFKHKYQILYTDDNKLHKIRSIDTEGRILKEVEYEYVYN